MANRRPTIVARAFDRRGRLVSIGINNYYKTHPLQAHFAKLAEQPKRTFLHAEIDALIRAGTKKVYSLKVERFNRMGQPVCAKPCEICQLAIKAFGVKKIEHT